MTLQKLRYSDAAYYFITITGELPQDVSEILTNFFSEKFTCKNHNQITHIEGLVKDQSALSGLLIYLCDLHYILLSVNIRKEQNK